jgi:predicted O-methyltransferase YrrM
MIKGPFSKYLNQQETTILINLVKSVNPKVMIEFGCNLGITAARLLENVPTLERYIGIDVSYDFQTTLKCQQSEVPYQAGIHAADDPRFYLLISESENLTDAELEPCDAVFIDGDHSEMAVLHESYLARLLIRPGGIICWHDYGNAAVEVTQALERLKYEGWSIEDVKGSWIAYSRVEKHNG